MSENVEASTSRNPKGFHGLYWDNFTLLHHDTASENGACLEQLFYQRNSEDT
jgi:hypothetical protein